VGLGVAEVERVHDHADVGRILSGLPHVRDLDQLEGGLVHGGLEILVALPVAVGLLDDDAALQQQLFQDLADVELGVAGVAHADGDVFEVAEHGQVFGLGHFAHALLKVNRR